MIHDFTQRHPPVSLFDAATGEEVSHVLTYDDYSHRVERLKLNERGNPIVDRESGECFRIVETRELRITRLEVIAR